MTPHPHRLLPRDRCAGLPGCGRFCQDILFQFLILLFAGTVSHKDGSKLVDAEAEQTDTESHKDSLDQKLYPASAPGFFCAPAASGRDPVSAV